MQTKMLIVRPLLALFALGMVFFMLEKIAARGRNQRFFRAEFATDLIYFLTAPLTKKDREKPHPRSDSPVWDIIFGKYYMPKNKQPKTFGIDAPMPKSFLGQIKEPFAVLFSKRERNP